MRARQPDHARQFSGFRRGIGGVAHGPSKSALNAVTVAFAQELADTNIKVNTACPGHTATDLNGPSGQRTVDEAAKQPVRLALLGDDGPTGTFSNDAGTISVVKVRGGTPTTFEDSFAAANARTSTSLAFTTRP